MIWYGLIGNKKNKFWKTATELVRIIVFWFKSAFDFAKLWCRKCKKTPHEDSHQKLPNDVQQSSTASSSHTSDENNIAIDEEMLKADKLLAKVQRVRFTVSDRVSVAGCNWYEFQWLMVLLKLRLSTLQDLWDCVLIFTIYTGCQWPMSCLATWIYIILIFHACPIHFIIAFKLCG